MNLLFKRLAILLGTLFFLLVIIIYFIIPPSLTVQTISQFDCNATVVSRTINKNWKKVFSVHTDSTFRVGLYDYQVREALYNGSKINITSDGNHYESKMMLLPLPVNKSSSQWTTTIKTGNNPISKIIVYFKVKRLQNNMLAASQELKRYLSSTISIYGFDISRSTLTDTTVLVTTTSSLNYPSTQDVYALIDKLKKYAAANKADVTNFPMLNVSARNNEYAIMVGLPVNMTLPQLDNISTKHLKPVKNKIVTTEVKGGIHTVQNAHIKIEQYMQDNSLSAPVIPFELLVTDRSKETDTAKWITKIIYPVF